MDGDNEFITGIVPSPSKMEEGQSVEHGAAQEQGQSTSKVQSKRNTLVRPRKKKIRTLQPLMRDVSMQHQPSSSDSEDADGDPNRDTTILCSAHKCEREPNWTTRYTDRNSRPLYLHKSDFFISLKQRRYFY